MIFRRINQGSDGRIGGGLPFYSELSSVAQRRDDMPNYQCWVCPSGVGIPFQFGVTSGGASSWRAVSAFGTHATVTLSLGALSQECYNTTKAFISYNGGAIASLASGVWYFEVVMSGIGSVFSDYFHVCTDRANNSILLKWKDTKEWAGGCYYGAGYENKMWLDSAFARPKIEYYDEVKDDGYGFKLPVFQSTQEIYGFDVIATDSMLNVLASVAMHNVITVTAPSTSPTTVREFRSSDTGERSSALAIIECTFKVDITEQSTIDEPVFELGTC
jgi:hypothetical protein